MTALPDLAFERAAFARGFLRVAGVDEVGRGPLCGPVVAAAVRLDPEAVPEGLNDSKRLSAARRAELYDVILRVADVSVAEASVAEIDTLNILRASHLAMCRAIAGLQHAPDHVLIDGNMTPRELVLSVECIVGGDGLSTSIAAASIVAKVRRDRMMVDLAQQHPGYGWERNAGYATAEHMQALRNLGPTPHHRRSFRPVHNILCQEEYVSS